MKYNLYTVMLLNVSFKTHFNMFKVFFNSQEIFISETLETALQFGLSLHLQSNVRHTVDVYNEDDSSVFITLVRS